MQSQNNLNNQSWEVEKVLCVLSKLYPWIYYSFPQFILIIRTSAWNVS